MKNFFLLLLLLIIPVNLLSGQNFTVHGGLAVSNVQFFVDTASIEPNKKAGIFFGLDSEFEIAENLYLGICTDYIQKGFRVKADTVILNDFTFKVNYVTIPVNIRYKFDLEDFWMTFEAGPYIGIGLNAKIKSAPDDVKVSFGGNEGELNLLDYGFNLGFGFEFEEVRFGINYSNGLNNIASSSKETMKNRCLTISLGVTL